MCLSFRAESMGHGERRKGEGGDNTQPETETRRNGDRTRDKGEGRRGDNQQPETETWRNGDMAMGRLG